MSNNFNFNNFQPPSYRDYAGLPFGYKPAPLPPPPTKYNFGHVTPPPLPKNPMAEMRYRPEAPKFDWSRHEVSIPRPLIHAPVGSLVKSQSSSRWDELVAKMNKSAPASVKPMFSSVPSTLSYNFELMCKMGSDADLFNRGRVHDLRPFIGHIERPLSMQLGASVSPPIPSFLSDHATLRARSNAFDITDRSLGGFNASPQGALPKTATSFLMTALQSFGKAAIDSPELFEFEPRAINHGLGFQDPLIGERMRMGPPEFMPHAKMAFKPPQGDVLLMPEPSKAAQLFSTMNKAFARAFETIGRGVVDSPELYDFHKSSAQEGKELKALIDGIQGVAELNISLSQKALRVLHKGGFGISTFVMPEGLRDVLIGDPYNYSQTLVIPGYSDSPMRLGVTQGMNSGLNGAKELAGRVHNITDGHEVTLVYNQPFGAFIDGILTLSGDLFGFSYGRERRLIKEWTEHYDLHKDDPSIKYLQIAHSRGAGVVHNALLKVPQEIRDHIFIVGLAPAKIIPDSLCFGSINMASKKDLVPFAELFHTRLINSICEPKWAVVSAFEDFSKFQKKMSDELIRFNDRTPQPIMGHLTSNPEFWERFQKVWDIYKRHEGRLTIEDKEYLKELVK